MKVKNFIEIQEEDNYRKVDYKIYKRPIGKLIYLSCSWPDPILYLL